MLHGRRVVGVKSMPLEKRAQSTLHSFQLKVGIAHLHMSLAIENAMGLTSLLVTTRDIFIFRGTDKLIFIHLFFFLHSLFFFYIHTGKPKKTSFFT